VQARAVLEQLGMYPLSKDQPGQRSFEYAKYANNAVFPPGITAEMIAANPEAARPDWVKPHSFWDDLGRMLDFNPQLAPDDAAIGDQARARSSLSTAATRTTVHSSTAPHSAPTPHSTTPQPTPRSGSTSATAGSGSRAPACGEATGTAGRSPRSSTSS
jgi:hypothetical protein